MKTDVLILGAGPAGCAAAIRARQSGLSVVILEAKPVPGLAPGETLHPGIEPLLKQLGVLDQVLRAGFRRHLGIWVERESQRQFSSYGEDKDGPWRGFQADRRMFHQILQRAALDAGATLIRNASPQAVLTAGGRVRGVVIEDRHVHATWTLDATGRSAWLARTLALPASRRSPPLRVRFGWGNSDGKHRDDQPSFVFREDGWDWKAPLSLTRIAWVTLRIGENNRHPAGIDLTWRLHPRCAGRGFFLLGDAAATLDPASSHGVLRAMMSGVLAGHLVAGCQYKGVAERAVIESYRTWLCAQFADDEQRLRQEYANSPARCRFLGEPVPVRSHNLSSAKRNAVP